MTGSVCCCHCRCRCRTGVGGGGDYRLRRRREGHWCCCSRWRCWWSRVTEPSIRYRSWWPRSARQGEEDVSSAVTERGRANGGAEAVDRTQSCCQLVVFALTVSDLADRHSRRSRRCVYSLFEDRGRWAMASTWTDLAFGACASQVRICEESWHWRSWSLAGEDFEAVSASGLTSRWRCSE